MRATSVELSGIVAVGTQQPESLLGKSVLLQPAVLSVASAHLSPVSRSIAIDVVNLQEVVFVFTAAGTHATIGSYNLVT